MLMALKHHLHTSLDWRLCVPACKQDSNEFVFLKVDEARESLVSRYPFVFFPVQQGVFFLGQAHGIGAYPVVMARG
jgi:hypothetical protein